MCRNDKARRINFTMRFITCCLLSASWLLILQLPITIAAATAATTRPILPVDLVSESVFIFPGSSHNNCPPERIAMGSTFFVNTTRIQTLNEKRSSSSIGDDDDERRWMVTLTQQHDNDEALGAEGQNSVQFCTGSAPWTVLGPVVTLNDHHSSPSLISLTLCGVLPPVGCSARINIVSVAAGDSSSDLGSVDVLGSIGPLSVVPGRPFQLALDQQVVSAWWLLSPRNSMELSIIATETTSRAAGGALKAAWGFPLAELPLVWEDAWGNRNNNHNNVPSSIIMDTKSHHDLPVDWYMVFTLRCSSGGDVVAARCWLGRDDCTSATPQVGHQCTLGELVVPRSTDDCLRAIHSRITLAKHHHLPVCSSPYIEGVLEAQRSLEGSADAIQLNVHNVPPVVLPAAAFVEFHAAEKKEGSTTKVSPPFLLRAMEQQSNDGADGNASTTTAAPVSGGSTTATPTTMTPQASTLEPTTTSTPSPTTTATSCNCQSLTGTSVLELTEDSKKGVSQIPSWFQDNNQVFPLVVARWSFPSTPATLASFHCNAPNVESLVSGNDTFVPLGGVATKWTLVPNSRYFDVPLGLLAAFTFGASYCKVGRVTLALARPICRSANDNVNDMELLWKQAAARYLDNVVQNVTSVTQQTSYASIDAVQPDVTSCYAATDASDGNDITLWDLTCLTKYSTTAADPTQTSSGSSSADGANETTSSTTYFTESNGAAPGLIIVIFFSIVCAIGCASTLLWYVWFTMSSLLQNKVKLTNRKFLPLAVKWRIVLAHLLAPFSCIAHAYAIYPVRSTSVGDAFFGLDILFSIVFVLATVLRLIFPRHRLITPVYLGGVLSLMFYTCCVFGGSTLWALAALSIDVRVIPYATAGALVLLQAAWQVKLCGEELAPSVSLISQTFRRGGGAQSNSTANNPEHGENSGGAAPSKFVQTVAPVNSALSLEMFIIVMLMFMFAVTQVEDISAFMAVIAAFIMVAYSFLANYSITRQLSQAFSTILHNDEDDFEAELVGAGIDIDDVNGRKKRTSPAEALISRLLLGSNQHLGQGGSAIQKELTRVARRMTRFDANDSITSSRSGANDDDNDGDENDGRQEIPPKQERSNSHRQRRDVGVDFQDVELLSSRRPSSVTINVAEDEAPQQQRLLNATTKPRLERETARALVGDVWEGSALNEEGAAAVDGGGRDDVAGGRRSEKYLKQKRNGVAGQKKKASLRFSSSSSSEGRSSPLEPSSSGKSQQGHRLLASNNAQAATLEEPLLVRSDAMSGNTEARL